MTRLRRSSCLVLLLGCLAASRTGAEVVAQKTTEAPSQIRPRLLVIGGDWAGRLPPAGSVNAPTFVDQVHPGQWVAVALMAQGAKRDQLLDGVRLDVRVTRRGASPVEFSRLQPRLVRPLKAQGADFALQAMTAGGISDADRAKLAQEVSLVTLAVWDTGWVVPESGEPVEYRLEATLSGGFGPAPAIEAATLACRPLTAWLQEPAPSAEELRKFINRHRSEVAPGYLINLLRTAADQELLKHQPIAGFFSAAFRDNSVNLRALLAAYPELDNRTQTAALMVLRLGGQNVSALVPGSSSSRLERLNQLTPLADLRQQPRLVDPVTPKVVGGLGNTMDVCWGCWIATGDATYLRALVDLLAGAPDYPALQAWQKAKGGEAGLNAAVARGLVYQIAGWSIGSFMRSDPLVADWIEYWRQDMTLPALVRAEIANLPKNPAFRRNQPEAAK